MKVHDLVKIEHEVVIYFHDFEIIDHDIVMNEHDFVMEVHDLEMILHDIVTNEYELVMNVHDLPWKADGLPFLESRLVS